MRLSFRSHMQPNQSQKAPLKYFLISSNYKTRMAMITVTRSSLTLKTSRWNTNWTTRCAKICSK